MEDDFDYGAQQAPQQAPQQQAPQGADAEGNAVPEFTAADNVRLQRLNAGLSAVQQQVDDGVLSPDEGARLYGQIHAMRGPLRQRQDATRQYQQQQAVGQAQQQQAALAGMEHSEAIYRAKGVGDRVGRYVDPDTGDVLHLIEDGNGKWQPLPAGANKDAAAGATTPGPFVSTPGMLLAGEAVNADAPRDPAQPPGQAPAVQPAPDGGHLMTIANGPNQEQWHFAPDGTTTLVGRAGPQAQQDQQQDQQPAGALTQAEVATAGRDAVQALHQLGVSPPGRTGNPRVDAQLAAQYQRMLAGMQGHLLVQRGKAKQSQANQQAIAGRQGQSQEFQQRQQADRQQSMKERADQQKADRDTQAHHRDLEGGYLKQRLDVEKAIDDRIKAGIFTGTGAPVKDAGGLNVKHQMPTREEREAEIRGTLGALGMDPDLNAFRKRHGIPVVGGEAAQQAQEPKAKPDPAAQTGISKEEAKAHAGAAVHPAPRKPTGGLGDVSDNLRRRFGG